MICPRCGMPLIHLWHNFDGSVVMICTNPKTRHTTKVYEDADKSNRSRSAQAGRNRHGNEQKALEIKR